MSEMVDRVARRLFAHDNGDLYTAGPAWEAEKREEPERAAMYLGTARVMIEAMRNPTEKMLKAFYGDIENTAGLDRDWNDMIDAALGESE